MLFALSQLVAYSVICSSLVLAIMNDEYIQNMTAYNAQVGGHPCADFNYGAAKAALAGLRTTYICPKDGIARDKCKEIYPTRNISEIVQSNIQWGDIMMYVLVGPGRNVDAFLWWLQFLPTEGTVDMVFVADACPNNSPNCSDAPEDLKSRATSAHSNLVIHIMRVNPQDNGYKVLSCKLRTGMKKTYEMFPNKKYYLKIDTDTLIFPKRLFSFLNTLHSVTYSERDPIYFGAVVESGMNLLLCGREWTQEGDKNKGGICYGQGGAGYGLNNLAMKSMTLAPVCTVTDPDKLPEDTFTAMWMWNEFRINVIHCGGFRSSELVSDELFKHSVSFHYIDSTWLHHHGNNVAEHYKNSHHS